MRRLIPFLLCAASFAQVAQPTLRNLYTGVPYDTTGGVLTATPSPSVRRPANLFSVQMTLVGGTSASGQVEGSNDGTSWLPLQTSAFILTTGQSNGLVFNAPWYYVRFNCLTNVGGGTVVAVMTW